MIPIWMSHFVDPAWLDVLIDILTHPLWPILACAEGCGLRFLGPQMWYYFGLTKPTNTLLSRAHLVGVFFGGVLCLELLRAQLCNMYCFGGGLRGGRVRGGTWGRPRVRCSGRRRAQRTPRAGARGLSPTPFPRRCMTPLEGSAGQPHNECG